MAWAPVMFVVLVFMIDIKIVRRLAFAGGRFQVGFVEIGNVIFFVEFGSDRGGPSRGLFGRLFSIASATASATATAAAFIVEFLSGHGLFQWFAPIVFGNGRSFNGIDNFVNMFAFVLRLLARPPFAGIASPATAAPPPAFAAAPRIVF